MTDDIVTRLREHASQIRCVVGVNESVVIPLLELEAACEIECLRHELADWKSLAEQAYSTAWNAVIGYMNDWSFPEKGTDEYEEYMMSWRHMDELRTRWETKWATK